MNKKIDYFQSINTVNLKNKAIKSAGINLVSQALLFIVRIGGTILLARLTLPSDFGLVAMVTTILFILVNFGFNGFPEYIIQQNEITHKEVSTIFWLHALISVFLTISFISVSPLIASFFKEPILVKISIVMSITIIGEMLSTYHLALLQRIMDFKKIAMNALISTITSTSIALAIAYKGYGYWAIVTRQTLAIIIQMFVSWITCRWIPGLPGSLKSIAKSFKYALNIYGSFILSYFEQNIDKLILGKFFGSSILGNYDRAYQLSLSPVTQLIPPLSNVGLATLSKLKNDPVRFQKYYEKAILTVAMIGFFLSLSLTTLGDNIILLLLGSKWKDTGLIFTIFAPGLSSMIIYATNSWLHISLSKPNRMLYWNTSVVIIRALTIGISAIFGPLAVASSISILYYLLLVPSIWYAGRPINLKIYPIIIGLLKFLIPAILSYFTHLLFFKYLNYLPEFLNPHNIILKMCVDFFFISICYIFFIIIINRNLKPFSEIVDFIRIFLNRKNKN